MSEMQLPQHNNRHSDELDLFEMFDYTFQKFKQLFVWLVNLALSATQVLVAVLAFIVKHIVWVIIFAIIGLGIARLKKGEYYEAELMAKANAISESDAISYINNLPKLLINGGEVNMHALAENLGMSESDVQHIVRLRAGFGIDLDGDGLADKGGYSSSDTGRVRGVFYVDVVTTDERVIPDVERGLMAYLYGNVYFREQAQLRVSQLQSKKVALEEQIERLGTLQQLMYSSHTVSSVATHGGNVMGGNVMGGNAMGGNAVIPLYHNEMIALQSNCLQLDADLASTSEIVTIVQPFVTLKVDGGRRLYKAWAMAFAALGLVLAFIWKYRALIIDTLKGGSRLNDMLANLKIRNPKQ